METDRNHHPSALSGSVTSNEWIKADEFCIAWCLLIKVFYFDLMVLTIRPFKRPFMSTGGRREAQRQVSNKVNFSPDLCVWQMPFLCRGQSCLMWKHSIYCTWKTFTSWIYTSLNHCLSFRVAHSSGRPLCVSTSKNGCLRPRLGVSGQTVSPALWDHCCGP